MTTATEQPLILTLGFADADFARLDAMRRAHFPAKRNHIPAHLTLFHKLPSDALGSLIQDLNEVAGDTVAFGARITGLRFLGYGSAYVVESGPLVALRAELARRWLSHLGRQDAQRFTPHVTIQNKVSAPEARTLFERLEGDFEPFEVEADSLLLWRYLDGPWEQAERVPLNAKHA